MNPKTSFTYAGIQEEVRHRHTGCGKTQFTIKKHPSAAKADADLLGLGGTAEAVPFQSAA